MGLITIPTITDGSTIDANDVNNIANPIVNELNGNIDYYNLKDNSITQAKLASNSVTTDKIADANVTMPKILNPYKARAYLGADQTGLTQNVYAKVSLGEESYDTNNNFASYGYTVPVTGYYQVNGKVRVRATTLGNLTGWGVAIYVGSVIEESRVYDNNFSADYADATISDVIYLTAGDVVYMYAIGVASAGTVYFSSTSKYTFLSIHLVSV